MTLQASFVWENPDSTKDLNARLWRIVERGVVWGGTINPNPASLNIEIDPFVAVSFDGMAVANPDPKTVLVAANTNNYIVVRARYNESGVPAVPTLYYQVLAESAYNLDPEKDYLIVLGRVDLAPTATSVSANDIYYDVKDEVTPVGRDWYQGKVAVPGDLPMPPPHANRIGDFYFVDSANTFYFWNGSSWEPLNTGSFNSETTIMNKGLVESEWRRTTEGSGVIAGVRPEQGNFASGTEIALEETPATANQIGLDTFNAVVNGHYIQTHGQYVPLDPKPGTGNRYDLVFLEVWREELTPPAASPETVDYEKNPDGSTTYTVKQVDDKLESLAWDAGITAVSGDNFSLHEINSYDHGWLVTRYRFSKITNVPSTVALYNPSHPTISAVATNIDGNPFSSQPAGSGMDDRLWMASAPTTSADGYSWAIPILVLNRDSTETYVQIFRDGVRTALPIYPVADVAHAARKALDSVHTSNVIAPGIDQYPYDEPSGFLSGLDHQIETTGPGNTLTLYEDQIRVRVRGVEEWLHLPGGADMDIGTPPATGYARTLVYLKMNFTLYDNATTGGTPVDNSIVSQIHHPYVPSNISGTFRGQGWKRGFVTWQFVYQTWNNTDYLDEDDAMSAAGWTRGDVTMAAAGAQYEDGGIWSRSIAIDADDRVHPMQAEWAIPICLVHRRNTGTWTYDTNPNGSPGRPDDRTDATVLHVDDLVDLRHEVGLSEDDVKERIVADMQKNMTGRLRTRLANKYQGSGTSGEVAGTRILQTDFIGNVPGEYNMEPGDGRRRIWSDAREFQVLSAQFDLLSSSSGTNYSYNYDGGNNRGTLTITAPTYASIVRHIPAITIAKGDDPDAADFMEFYGPPLWTSQKSLPSAGLGSYPTPVEAKYMDSSSGTDALEPIVFYWPYDQSTTTASFQGFEVTRDPISGNAVSMTGYIDTSGVSGSAVISWWVHYDRSYTAPLDVNYGLAEIPDEVHKITKDPLGSPEQINLGPLYCTVKKTLTSASSVTISDTDVAAASGMTGTITLVGLGDRFLESSVSIPTTTMTLSRDAITDNFSLSYTGEYQAVVYFYTSDVSKWVEVGKGGKSVQAYFEWNEDVFPFGSQPASSGNRTRALGEDHFVNAKNPFGRTKNDNSPLINPTAWLWNKTATGTEWTLRYVGLENQEFTNFLTFSQGGLDEDALLICSVHKTLSSAASDTLQIDYTYTPYQGLSSTGGKAAVIGPTTIQNMKNYLHGEIVDNSDFFVTQNGASSYFSGVECWTGTPFNHHFHTSDTSTTGARRFEDFNRTGLVMPDGSIGGVADLQGLSGWRASCPAASVLRLPFPCNFNMVVSSYHSGVMDFDLDPARAGSASGEFTYAPGYPGGPTSVSNARKDQFINGLSPLRIPPDDRLISKSMSMLASSWVVTSAHTADSFPARNSGTYRTGAITEVISVVADVPEATDHLLQRALTFCQGQAGSIGFGDSTVPTDGSSGVRIRGYENQNAFSVTNAASPAAYLYQDYSDTIVDYRYTATDGSGATNDWYVSYHPGTVIMYYLTNVEPNLLVGIEIALAQISSSPVAVLRDTLLDLSSDFSIGREFTYTMAGMSSFRFVQHYQQFVDTIVLPYESTSTTYNKLQRSSRTLGSIVKGLTVEYPTSWTAGTISNLENLYAASIDLKGSGRGIYLGSSTDRFNMGVFVPGSGTPLSALDPSTVLQADPEGEPLSVTYKPPIAPFAETKKVNHPYDHGGPTAYSCFGLGIRPSSNAHKNRLVLQITGGPIGLYDKRPNSLGNMDPSDLDGTAIDAFWPTGRPILKPKK